MEVKMTNKKRAILITGFSNWGKTTIIYRLFNRNRIYRNTAYEINVSKFTKSFIVMPYSNDDITNPQRFLTELNDRYSNAADDVDLLSAFCPSSEDRNNSKEILGDEFFEQFDEIIIIYLVDRWDNHASLNIGVIKDFYNDFEKRKNLKHIEIVVDNSKSDDDRLNDKITIIKNELENIYQQKE
jgi:hypothetical protein